MKINQWKKIKGLKKEIYLLLFSQYNFLLDNKFKFDPYDTVNFNLLNSLMISNEKIKQLKLSLYVKRSEIISDTTILHEKKQIFF